MPPWRPKPDDFDNAIRLARRSHSRAKLSKAMTKLSQYNSLEETRDYLMKTYELSRKDAARYARAAKAALAARLNKSPEEWRDAALALYTQIIAKPTTPDALRVVIQKSIDGIVGNNAPLEVADPAANALPMDEIRLAALQNPRIRTLLADLAAAMAGLDFSQPHGGEPEQASITHDGSPNGEPPNGEHPDHNDDGETADHSPAGPHYSNPDGNSRDGHNTSSLTPLPRMNFSQPPG